MRARQVLDDCRRAFTLLDEEKDPQTFRICWVAAVSLCRAVGHVLEKVDTKLNPAIAPTVQTKWERIKKHDGENRIFHEFIERERNLILKQYEMSPDTETQPIALVGIDQLFTLERLLFCPLQDGPYQGEDCRDILAEAIEWWDAYLADIESTLPRKEST